MHEQAAQNIYLEKHSSTTKQWITILLNLVNLQERPPKNYLFKNFVLDQKTETLQTRGVELYRPVIQY